VRRAIREKLAERANILMGGMQLLRKNMWLQLASMRVSRNHHFAKRSQSYPQGALLRQPVPQHLHHLILPSSLRVSRMNARACRRSAIASRV
jgi:hypothetical protein